MKQEFSRPNFLRPETSIKPKYSNPETGEKRFNEGTFAYAAELKRIPLALRKAVPEGFMLKKYYFGEYSPLWNELFNDLAGSMSNAESWVKDFAEMASEELGRHPEPQEVFDKIPAAYKNDYNISIQLVSKVLSEFSLESKVKKLKERYERIKSYFAKDLPELIVPTQFIIGSERDKKNKTRDGQRHIYEFQPKLESLDLETKTVAGYIEQGNVWGSVIKNFLLYENVPLDSNIVAVAKLWAQQIKTAFPQKCEQIKKELLALIAITRQLPRQEKEIPYDVIHPYNLKFTKDGIRVFDVNQAPTNFSPSDERYKHFRTKQTIKKYHRLLDIWQAVADEL